MQNNHTLPFVAFLLAMVAFLLAITSFLLAMSAVSAAPSAGADDENYLALVLDVNDRLNAEILNGNASAVQAMLSDQFIVTDPSNTVRSKDDLVAVVARGLLRYDSFETEVDVIRQLGDDLVVLMGIQTSTQSAVPTDGKMERTATSRSLKHRFTNLYRKEDGTWRLLVKQSTVIAVE